jgi:hypothetical protein
MTTTTSPLAGCVPAGVAGVTVVVVAAVAVAVAGEVVDVPESLLQATASSPTVHAARPPASVVNFGILIALLHL